MGRARIRPAAVAAGKGYSHPALRRYLRRRGIRAVVPSKADQPRPPTFDKAAYRERSQVERTINRPKSWPRVVTRYGKREVNDLAMVTVATIVLRWLEWHCKRASMQVGAAGGRPEVGAPASRALP